MPRFHAPAALLPQGWATDVLIEADARGSILSVTPQAAAAGAERLHGPVVPGIPDLHSHAFQRAMAGLAETGGPAGDSFWSWRDLMYRFVGRLGPREVEAIATQLQVELLRHGYTSVAEFHYLHNDRGGVAYEEETTLCDAVCAAAGASGIGLTLLPVAYRRGGFGGRPASEAQARFVLDAERYARLVATLARRHRGDQQVRVGVAPHSLRAVDPSDLAATLAAIDAVDPKAPVHIHVAETRREVEDCIAWSGARPVAWLLDHAPVDERWCIVHATHMDEDETRRLARSGAVAGICPTTEANLGDGFFPATGYAAAGGRIGFGSDSNVSTSPVEELRWFEYGRRLASGQRNLSAPASGSSTGAALLRQALSGGAQAMGRPVGAIAPGFRADLVVLDHEHPILAERSGDAMVDAWIFSGNDRVVRDVVVGGQWLVREGHHAHEEQARADFASALRRLLRED